MTAQRLMRYVTSVPYRKEVEPYVSGRKARNQEEILNETDEKIYMALRSKKEIRDQEKAEG